MAINQLNKGYTLIEMAVVLLVLSAILAGGLSILTTQNNHKKLQTTQYKLSVIDNALIEYAKQHDALPCPVAYASGEPQDIYSDQVALADVNPCNNGIDHSNGVVGGDVPYGTLGLPAQFFYDGWNRRIKYVVSRNLVATNAFLYNDNAHIEITSDGINPTQSNVAYVLLSYGKNGAGATKLYNYDENFITPQVDFFNSLHTHQFVVWPVGTIAAPLSFKFDDIIIYKPLWHLLF